jgi:hypothetical protein
MSSTVQGTDDVRLSSPLISLGIKPKRGANLYSILTPTEPRGWIFYDPSRVTADEAADLGYDDVWSGGFEELFPNDAPGWFEGRSLRDHGELWNAPFDILEHSDTHVRVERRCMTVPAIVRKTVSLHQASAGFDVAYEIEHVGQEPFHFLFKLHAAIRIETGDRLLLPGGRVTPVDPSFGGVIRSGCDWPLGPSARGSGTADLSLVPDASTRLREFVYVSQLPEGWCGLQRQRTGEAIVFRYPLDKLPYCWLFLTYGGWRDYYTAVLEPCTNMPKDLTTAKARGTSARLDPGQTFEFTVSVTIRGTRE